MGSNESTPIYAYALLAMALLAVSSAGAVLQQMGEIPPLLRASWRMQGTSLVLLPGFVYQWSNMDRSAISRNDWLLMLASSAFLALHFGSWIWSLDNTSLVHSLLFVTSHPLVVVALMPILGTAVRRGHITGALVGFVGAAITLGDISGDDGVTLIGDIAAFFGAVTVVGYLFIGRHLRSNRSIPVFVYAFPVTLLAGIFLAASSMGIEGTSISSALPELSVLGWGEIAWIPWVAYLSLGPGLCGHTVINTVLKWISPIIVSITLLFEPVIGGLIGWIWTGEITLGIWTLVGGPMMVYGAIIVTLEEGMEEGNEEVHS
ncbi:MAG: hypothetical protein CMB53_01125 [Euryarchaeota archaeon]|nr:hypothetical protein [Euryarchaeota archaeon]|tara:strand:- start:10128 stop:11081 length:954 start_codon:yes stop_codon:yes gene_type:complete